MSDTIPLVERGQGRHIGPLDLIAHMQVPEERGLYVLGGFERRVTLLSQQVRALNLVFSLFEERLLQSGNRVCLVGGGAAGMTVAAAAASKGCKVVLLEKSKVLPLFRGNHSRWLHPHIYDSLEEELGHPEGSDYLSRLHAQNKLAWEIVSQP